MSGVYTRHDFGGIGGVGKPVIREMMFACTSSSWDVIQVEAGASVSLRHYYAGYLTLPMKAFFVSDRTFNAIPSSTEWGDVMAAIGSGTPGKWIT